MDDGDRKKGEEALNKLGEAEGSPHVSKHAAHLRKMLSAAGDAPGEPAPVPTP